MIHVNFIFVAVAVSSTATKVYISTAYLCASNSFRHLKYITTKNHADKS